MYCFKDEINKELASISFLLEKIDEMELSNYEGSLLREVRNNDVSYILRKSETVDGKRRQSRIPLGGPDSATVIEIKRTRYFNAMRDSLIKNKQLLERLAENYEDYSPDALEQQLPSAYRGIPEECLADPHAEALREWAAAEYEHNSKAFPENPNVAIDGTVLRSKAEVIIYNMLLFYNIPFRYEVKTMYIGEDNVKEIRYPDFIFKLANGRELHWEHFGMLSDDWYFDNNFCKKMKLYHRNGITLGDNLIVTCDTKDNTINTQMIDLIIRGIIMPLL